MSSAASVGESQSLPSDLKVRHLGTVDYEPVWRAMQAFTDQRDAQTPDELWVLQHKPVFTLGQAGKDEHVLAAGDIPVLNVDRGGQVTYHGPGQIVIYPLVDIRRLGIGVRDLVTLIEDVIIDVLGDYGQQAARAPGAPGVYIDGVKIAALGLRVRRGCSFHGLAFNIDMDLEPFQRINPCGYQGLKVTSLAQHAPVSFDEVETRLIARLANALGYSGRVQAAAPDINGIERDE